MKFETKYKLLLLKRYFDAGYSLTSYFKYGIVGLAVLQPQLKEILTIIGLIYVPLCFPLGYFFYKCNWAEAEAEVGNRFNLFQKEVRGYLNGRTKR